MSELNNNFLDLAKDWINNNQGKAIGIAIGLLFAIFLIAFGVVNTLLIVLFVSVGYWMGKSRDENVSMIDQIQGQLNKIFKK